MARIRHRLRELARNERGMALPTALFAMIAAFALASVAVLSSVNAQHGTTRDHYAKEAIAAADAGAGVALLRINRFHSSLSAAKPCVGSAGEALEATGGWCPPISAESVGQATYSYRVSAFAPSSEVSVVATGSAGGVERRIEMGLVSHEGEKVFENEGLVGEAEITIEGTPDIRTNIGTNGNVVKSGDGTICGSIRRGIGKEAPEPECEGEPSEANKTLPPLTLPEGIETNNSNCRLIPDCPKPTNPAEIDTTKADSYCKKRCEAVPWDPSTRTINVNQNSTLTMGGEDYFICRLFVENGDLIMAGGAEMRIFFDTPENCGLKEGEPQVRIIGNATIESSGYNEEEGSYAMPALYLLGSPTVTTTVELSGTSNGTNEMLLYAPNSEIIMGGNATWIGAIGGKSLRMHGTPRIEAPPVMPGQDLAYSSLWERTHYVECVPTSATAPNAGC
jgi:hypothetical protein